METTQKLDCGHAPTPQGCGTGIAIAPGGLKMCYPCADQKAREYLTVATRFSGYVNSDGTALTTWSGGKVATVTELRHGKRQYTPTGGSYRVRIVRAVTPDGTHWYGRGSDAHDLISMRRAKH